MIARYCSSLNIAFILLALLLLGELWGACAYGVSPPPPPTPLMDSDTMKRAGISYGIHGFQGYYAFAIDSSTEAYVAPTISYPAIGCVEGRSSLSIEGGYGRWGKSLFGSTSEILIGAGYESATIENNFKIASGNPYIDSMHAAYQMARAFVQVDGGWKNSFRRFGLFAEAGWVVRLNYLYMTQYTPLSKEVENIPTRHGLNSTVGTFVRVGSSHVAADFYTGYGISFMTRMMCVPAVIIGIGLTITK